MGLPNRNSELAVANMSVVRHSHKHSPFVENRVREQTSDYPLNFLQEYEAYQTRCNWTAEYKHLIEDHARKIRDKLTVIPNFIIAMPAREEEGLKVAVSAVLEDAASSNLKPLVIVFDNYVKDQNPSVLDGFDPTAVYSISEEVDSSWGIGDVRGFPTDIGLELIKQLIDSKQITENEVPIIGSCDGDITEFRKQGTLQIIKDIFDQAKQDKQVVDAVALDYDMDIESFRQNENLYKKLLVRRHFKTLLHTISPDFVGNIIGSASFFDAASLAAAGSFPPVNLGEDVILGSAFSMLRGKANTVKIMSNLAVVTEQKSAMAKELQGSGYYSNWVENRSAELPDLDQIVITNHELAVEIITGYNRVLWIVHLLADKSNTDPILLKQYVYAYNLLTRVFNRLWDELIVQGLGAPELVTSTDRLASQIERAADFNTIPAVPDFAELLNKINNKFRHDVENDLIVNHSSHTLDIIQIEVSQTAKNILK